jgi:hypothetical protein
LTSEIPRRGLINRRLSGYKEKDFTFGTWNVRTLVKTGALIPERVLYGKFHNTKPVGKPRIRWEDVVRRDISQILVIRGWRRRPEDREKWREASSEGDQGPEGAVTP